MPRSGIWAKDQTFKCTDFNCGCELKMITPPHLFHEGSPRHPVCLCGSPMRQWPNAAIRSDQFNDI